MIWIREYHKLLKDYFVTEYDGHLLLPETRRFSDKKKGKIVRSLFECFGDTRASDENFKLVKKKTCTLKECVSPQCYDFRVNIKSIMSSLDNDDVVEIAKTIDLNNVDLVGPKKYLEEYNKNQPDIFKLSMSDFKIVLSYMKGLQDDRQKD